jgi:hypothetical protein
MVCRLRRLLLRLRWGKRGLLLLLLRLLLLLLLLGLGPVARRGADHEQEALLRSGQLGNVMLGVRAADMLLHGAIAFFLDVVCAASMIPFMCPRGGCFRCCGDPSQRISGGDMNKAQLTPMHRFRQLEPSWLRNGQTTSLLASVTGKDDVRFDLGGILGLRTIQCRARSG